MLPLKEIMLVTSLPKDKVEDILKENIQQRPKIKFGFSAPQNQKLFNGIIENNHFEIRRVIYYRNSFLPIIKGNIYEEVKTKIKLNIEPEPIIMGFIVLWLGGVGLASISSFVDVLLNETDPMFCIILSIMFGFGIGLTAFGFITERKKAIDNLLWLLDARIE